MEVIFADDHVLVRESIAENLRRIEPITTVKEVSSLEEALAAVSPRAGLVLLDLQMPGMNGLEGLDRMIQMAGTTPIVVMSGFIDKRTVTAVLDRKVSGFIPKTASGKTLRRAIQTVLDGERYIPSILLDGADDGSSPPLAPGRQPSEPASDSPFRKLTEREREIIKLLVAGRSNKQIGLQLGLQEITVKIHVRNAYRKIGAVNRADAVRLSYEQSFSTLAAASTVTAVKKASADAS